MLEIHLLGQQSIVVDGAPRTAEIPPRTMGLVAHLALHCAEECPRAGVASVFWPDSAGEQSLTNLRRELHVLRRQLPEFADDLHAAGGLLRWTPSSTTECDVVRFLAAAADGGHAREEGSASAFIEAGTAAVRAYGGDLLPTWADEWVLSQRDRLHRCCVELLTELAAALRDVDVSLALMHAQRRLEMEPFAEVGYRAVMELQAASGDRAAAIRTFHRCVSLLDRELGVAPDPATVTLYETLSPSAGTGGRTASVGRGPGRSRLGLVGRVDDLARLRRRWVAAQSGAMGVQLLTGQAGVGKSRLMAELASEVNRSGGIVARARCFESGARLALAPVAEWLGSRALLAERHRLAPAWAVEVERLVPTGTPQGPPQPMIDAWQRHRFFEGLAQAVLAPERPTLLTLDDIQWCDTETLAWLQLLARHARGYPLLIVTCAREEEIADNVELLQLLRALERDATLTRTEVPPLSPAAAVELARQVGANVVDQDSWYEATMGYPLFVIEAARSSSDVDTTVTSALGGSARVQALLEGRLAQLSDDAASVARLTAVVGRDVTLELLEEASDLPEASVVAGLDELWRRRLVVQHSRGAYDFAHDLFRDASLRQIPTPRLALLHRRVAQALELDAGRKGGAVAAAVAHHYEQAGVEHRALPFHIAAAEFAVSRFANEDAIEHYVAAARLLEAAPPGPDRDRDELAVLHAMSQPITARRGYASPLLEVTMQRAVALAERIGDSHLRAASLVGLFSPYVVQGRLLDGYEVARRALDASAAYPDVLGQAHFSLAGAATMLGRLDEALRHFDVVPDLTMGYPAALVGTRPEVHSRAWQGHALWLSGRPAEARSMIDWAVHRSEEVDHPYSLAVALAYAAMLAQFDHRRDDVAALTRQTSELCDRFGFVYYGDWSTILDGWAHGGVAGLAAIERGLAGLRAQGARLRRPYYLTLYADVLLSLDRKEPAVAALNEARADSLDRNDVSWLPDILRRLAALGTTDEAHALLSKALRVAYEQGSHGHVPSIEAQRSALPAREPARTADRTLPERSSF